MTSGSSWTTTFGGNAINPSQPSYAALTIAANQPLVWPLESAGGQPYVAAQIDVTATAGGLQLQMPPGNTGSNGAQSLVTNVGTNAFTVTDQAGNAIAVIATTQTWLITLIDNTTANGSWRAYQLGSTVSEAVAASLAGNGLQAVGSQLVTFWGTRSTATNTTIASADRSTLIEWTGMTGTFQLGATASLTPGWFCGVTNQGTGAVTVTCTGGELIDGLPSITLQPGNSGMIIARSGNFSTVGILVGTLSIAEGGTGATSAGQALTNFGGTSVGIAIFTAPDAASVTALLGLNNFTFKEASVSTDQTLAAGSANSVFVCTAALSLTLPLTTTLTTTFVFCAYAKGGTVTVVPQASDAINGAMAGANFTLGAGQAALFTTDASGNWWPLFEGIPAPGGNATIPGTLTVVGNATFDGTATVDGIATLNGAATFNGTATFAVGGTADFTASNGLTSIQTSSGSPGNAFVGNVGNTGSTLALWQFAASPVGSVTTNGTTTTYNTTSDQRLKIDDGLISGDDAGRVVDGLQPRWFRWKKEPDNASEPGFFAQQVCRVFPWAVRRAVGRGEKHVPWQMDQAKLMPVVVAELQSLRARVAKLERKR